MKDMSSSLCKSDCILIQLAINISTSYMAKKRKKPQCIHQLYIFSNVRDIYLITENNCSKKGTDC